MSQQPRRDREWEHWPHERRLDDGIRHKLRALFHPTTLGDEAVEEFVALQGRELEERAAQLAETIADLERREARAGELRTAVEQMLRRGSAELDERHGELTEIAAQLAEREARATRLEEALAERRGELGAVELRRAAVERREAAAGEHEQALARRAAELAERERAIEERERAVAELERRAEELARRSSELATSEERLARSLAELDRQRAELGARSASLLERQRRLGDLDARARDLERAEAAVAAREAALEGERTTVAGQREELRQAVASLSAGLGLAAAEGAGATRETAHVLFVPGERYRLLAAVGPPPLPGAEVAIDARSYRVVRIGSSPLPGDDRRCALVEPLPAAE